MSNVATQRERLLDLLADRALVGLNPVESEELGRLLVDFPDVETMARDIELAAASIALANIKLPVERLPEHLIAKIEADAQDGMPTTVHKMAELNAAAAAVMASRQAPSHFRSGAKDEEVTTTATAVPMPKAPSLASTMVVVAPPPAAAPPDLGPAPPAALKRTFHMATRPVPPPAPSSAPAIDSASTPQKTTAPVAPFTGFGEPSQPLPQLPSVEVQQQHMHASQPLPQLPRDPHASQPLPQLPRDAHASQQLPYLPQQQQQPSNVIPMQRPTVQVPTSARSGGSGSKSNWGWTGWLAAAACLLLAAGTWYLRPRTQIVTVNVPTPPSAVPTVSAPPPPVLTAAQERDQLLAKAGTAKLDWKPTVKDPASKVASGDVVWNAIEQKGFMRFKGLAKNDKRANVYQLWIFDKSRDDKYPVDGGVFEIDDDSGDVIVPIKARLTVNDAALFAVTVEKPGGVVVSKRERIVMAAKPTG